MSLLTATNLPTLNLLSRGKVRDIYSLPSSPDHLLFIATDRISAYDVVLKNGIPGKGAILTKLSIFWFQLLEDIIPNHFVTSDIDQMPQEVREYKDQLEGRTMLVKKAEIVPIEAIVRGYLTGSAYGEYTKSKTVHGMAVPDGMIDSEKFPEPIFTPSTKAEQGAHDENISHDQARAIVGNDIFEQIKLTSLALYSKAATYALKRGVILADTKFEFGLVATPKGKTLILVDEVLTPDSSRYWPLEGYSPGQPQPSFDKQYLRDWLTIQGFRKGLETGPPGQDGEGWVMTELIVKGTQARYEEAVQLLTCST